MDARQELEKLERECREDAVCAGQHGDRAEEDEFNRIASQIAAIREGLGKAQGEPVAWFRTEEYSRPGESGTRQRIAFGKNSPTGDGWRAMCLCDAPPADSAQVLVDALEHDKRLLESELADFAAELEVRGHYDLVESAIARLNNCKNDYRSAK